PVRADDAVARHDDRDGIASRRGTRCARRALGAGAPRELRVRDRLPVRDARDLAPDALLERRAAGRERQIEIAALAVEVFGELAGASRERRAGGILDPA